MWRSIHQQQPHKTSSKLKSTWFKFVDMELCSHKYSSCDPIPVISTEQSHLKSTISNDHCNSKLQQSRNRKIIAQFLDGIPDTGWWYWIPKLTDKSNVRASKTNTKIEEVLPHFGTIFGLTEDATAIILMAMGCVREHGSTCYQSPYFIIYVEL